MEACRQRFDRFGQGVEQGQNDSSGVDADASVRLDVERRDADPRMQERNAQVSRQRLDEMRLADDAGLHCGLQAGAIDGGCSLEALLCHRPAEQIRQDVHVGG